jgi:hypothetical protein
MNTLQHEPQTGVQHGDNPTGAEMPASTKSIAPPSPGAVSPRRVCAWCGLVMAEGSEPATHGACPVCSEKWLRDALNLAGDVREMQIMRESNRVLHEETLAAVREMIDRVGSAGLTPVLDDFNALVDAAVANAIELQRLSINVQAERLRHEQTKGTK